jgi:polysaccharide export outer membrane protein
VKTTSASTYTIAIFALLTATLMAAIFPKSAIGVDAAGAHQTARTVPDDYSVQPGDILFVSVWREPTLQGQLVVQPDGGIRFPLAGEIDAAGLTLTAIENRLTKKLKNYIPEPVVSVSLLQSTGNRVYIVGKVINPGEYVLTRNIDVMQALALAGGMTPFAKKKQIKVLREEKGRQKTFRFNYQEVESGERLGQNILLRPGDTVVVP